KSRVLILDEPTNHLSVKETAKVLGFVRSLPAQGVTGILISHNLHHVFQSCDRVVAMARGEIVFDKPVGATNVDEVSDALCVGSRERPLCSPVHWARSDGRRPLVWPKQALGCSCLTALTRNAAKALRPSLPKRPGAKPGLLVRT